MNTSEQLQTIVRDFGRDLELISEGALYWLDDSHSDTTTGETYTDENGNDVEREAVDIFDYIERHALAIENWKINQDGQCVGGEVILCFGGPTVWADERGVHGRWWRDRADWGSAQAGGAVLEYLAATMQEAR